MVHDGSLFSRRDFNDVSEAGKSETLYQSRSLDANYSQKNKYYVKQIILYRVRDVCNGGAEFGGLVRLYGFTKGLSISESLIIGSSYTELNRE